VVLPALVGDPVGRRLASPLGGEIGSLVLIVGKCR